MIPMTLGEVAAVTGGKVVNADPSLLVDGPVEYDSRLEAALFVAFDGEKVDGHDFVGQGPYLGTRDVGVPGVVVADQLAALAALARHSVSRLPDLTIVGLTGSSGKTTTKDYIGQLLSRLGPTIAPAGSLNNELGFPYTALKATADTRHLVLEMGARGMGHLRYLSEIAPPRIGLVLNIGAAHIGEFGTVEGTALAKGELVEALPADGVAVLNADDPLVLPMASRTKARVVTFGEAASSDVRATEVELDDRGRASYLLNGRPVRLAVTGRHQVSNTLAAAAVASELGLSLADVAAALGEIGIVSSRRMDVFDRPDGVTVIDDSYNANPSSMAAALRSLATIGSGRRTIAVLGYMAELGSFETDGHAETGELASELGVDLVIAVAAPFYGTKAQHAEDQAAAIALLEKELRPGDVVLVKGSRYRTWDVVDSLRPEGVRP